MALRLRGEERRGGRGEEDSHSVEREGGGAGRGGEGDVR